ncbi:LVIVD repeat-containing protein [Nocardiopsis sediminis]|uniref:LVIVD repeat-containing protein n=1 Tax=Nocardiopsis sediminis TaxID=1778267 RepID=A0ABV8FUW4_9ACTN
MPTSPAPSQRRRTLHRTGLAGAAIAGLLLSLVQAPAALADANPPGEGTSSDNITHLANIPKPSPVDGTNSDLAFSGDYAIGGNYNGFVIYDISTPAEPEITATVLCEGGQGDVSVSGDLLYYSVDYPRESEECGAPESSPEDADAFEGIRIFDISDKANPQYVAAVPTDCGSHTNTLVPGDAETDYIYVSSYAPSERYPNCQPPHDKISIIEVPKNDPASAAIAAEPVLFPDGGNHDQPGLLRPTEGCHDITVFPSRDIAAGACMGDGLILDIADPLEPTIIDHVRDDNFAFWHSATFTNDARGVLFTDELGGGGAPTCTEEIGPERGANAVYSLSRGNSPELSFESYFKIDRHQGDQTCVAHNGSLIPVPGKNFFVQSWYEGGVSVIDFNDLSNPVEIGYFDPDPRVDPDAFGGDTWSTYYYNGHVYSSDIVRGLDVLEIDDDRLNGAERVTYDEFNPQSQPVYSPGRG